MRSSWWPYLQALKCPGASFSGSAFSGPATWSIIFQVLRFQRPHELEQGGDLDLSQYYDMASLQRQRDDRFYNVWETGKLMDIKRLQTAMLW